MGEAEPLQSGRRPHASGRCSVDTPRRSSGVAGTARGERNALNTGALAGRGSRPQRGAQDGSRGVAAYTREESDGAIVLTRAVKAVGGKGTQLDDATPAGKGRGLWRHWKPQYESGTCNGRSTGEPRTNRTSAPTRSTTRCIDRTFCRMPTPGGK